MIEAIVKRLFGTSSQREIKRFQYIIDKINALEPSIRIFSDDRLRWQTVRLKRLLASGMTLDDLLIESFATVRETARRVLRMRHFDVQLIGGIVLHQGKIAEMKTGEGKTLVATLPAYLNSLTGEGVHIVTVNDYLARRDSEWMGEIFRFLGLTVGTIQHDMDDSDRKLAYLADITYGTNNEFGFDYLRDNMKFNLESFVQREHYFAIVDEVDSILIDEARTPLIISGPTEESTDKYFRINQLIPHLRKELHYHIDEKSRTVSMNDEGIATAEKFLSITNLYDPSNIEILHHTNQALRAHTLFKRDVDYVVKNNEVIIVDEFTGRLMPGRRYSEGLHQALEAKEGVHIANENQTLASITFQNYFRLYKKLSGMTGTAETEKEEFMHIYKLKVVVIPTNRTLIRMNYPDVIFRTSEEKYKAVVEEISQLNKAGRPVLVGTISIENSEKLSRMLKRVGIKHHVLNAKHHEKEAQIVAQAGQAGAVTIATNMAGRGTDIVLGRGVVRCPRDELGSVLCCINCEENCSSCPKPGNRDAFKACSKNVPCGLHIIGTERHEARRIDNQLRGRSGRQGDPGSSRFYLSLEDDLMRIFVTDRVSGVMERLGMEEGIPIEHKMVTRAIENAQKKVESNHFASRKHLIEYDDVMNKQRTVVYEQRRRILEGINLSAIVSDMIEDVLDDYLAEVAPSGTHTDDWEIEKLGLILKEKFLVSRSMAEYLPDEYDEQVFRESLLLEIIRIQKLKEEEFGKDLMDGFRKYVLLWVVDSLWKDHLLAMDHLREGIGLRGYGQRDPLVEYKKEAYEAYQEMMVRIKHDVVKYVTFGHPAAVAPRKRKPLRTSNSTNTIRNGSQAQDHQGSIRKKQKVGRNDPCPCGSGKKYKHCHGR